MCHTFKKIILKIGLLEPSEVETDPLKTDGQEIVQTDGHIVLNIGTWCHTFQTKKNFEKWTVRTVGSGNRPSKDRLFSFFF